MPDHLEFGRFLTTSETDHAIRRTFLGQAHIAGTGPAGKTCRECAFFGNMEPNTQGGAFADDPWILWEAA